MPTKTKKKPAKKPARRREEPIKAYHLLPADGRLARGDNRVVVVGKTLEVEEEPRLCKAGLHASRRCLDTLQYSPGSNSRLCLVEVSGDVKFGDDKICGRRRKVTVMLTSKATARLLQEFSCKAAEMALDLAEQKGDTSAVTAAAAGRKAVEMARSYLRGDCTEEELKVAGDATWVARVVTEYSAWVAGNAAWAARYAALAARYAAGAAWRAVEAGVPHTQLAAVLEEMVQKKIGRKK